jgi:flagellar biogenesis protein FliO
LQLIRVGTRVLVVGLGPDGARTLAEITEPIEVDVLVGACKTNRPEVQVTKSFQQFFERKVSS